MPPGYRPKQDPFHSKAFGRLSILRSDLLHLSLSEDPTSWARIADIGNEIRDIGHCVRLALEARKSKRCPLCLFLLGRTR